MKETIKNSNNSITLKEILISEKQFTKTNYKRLQKALVYIEENLIDSDGYMYLTVDSLKEINNNNWFK